MSENVPDSEFIASLGLSANLRAMIARTAREYELTGQWVDFDTLTYEAVESDTSVDLNEVIHLPGVLAFRGTGETVELTGLGLLIAGTAPEASALLARLAGICGMRKLALRSDATIGRRILIEEYDLDPQQAARCLRMVRMLPGVAGGGSGDEEWSLALNREALTYRDVGTVDELRRILDSEAAKHMASQRSLLASAQDFAPGGVENIFGSFSADPTSPPAATNYDFDVAMSFAGEDREYVDSVVEGLKTANLRVFYDSDFQAELWGQDLAEFFDSVYRERSRFTIMFVSTHYAEKMWTRHERRSALARALEQVEPYVLPVRLDDTALPGLRPTVGYLDARQVGVGGVVAATISKAGDTPAAVPSSIKRVPRTEVERQRLLIDLPGGWEYLYLASCLLQERSAIESKYHDHEMRFSQPHGDSLDRAAAAQALSAANQDAVRLVANLDLAMDQRVQTSAFGEPGEPGHPERIAHMAKRWNSIYESLMDWAADVRGLRAPSEFRKAVDLLASMVDESVAAYRTFVDSIVAQSDAIPMALRNGEQVMIDLTLAFTIPDELIEALSVELERLSRK